MTLNPLHIPSVNTSWIRYEILTYQLLKMYMGRENKKILVRITKCDNIGIIYNHQSTIGTHVYPYYIDEHDDHIKDGYYVLNYVVRTSNDMLFKYTQHYKIIEKFSIDEAIKNFISNFKNNTIILYIIIPKPEYLINNLDFNDI